MSKLQERRRRQLQQQQDQHQQREQQQQQQQRQQQHQEFSTVNNNNCNKHVTTSPVGCDKRCCPVESSSHQNGKFWISVKIKIQLYKL